MVCDQGHQNISQVRSERYVLDVLEYEKTNRRMEDTEKSCAWKLFKWF